MHKIRYFLYILLFQDCSNDRTRVTSTGKPPPAALRSSGDAQKAGSRQALQAGFQQVKRTGLLTTNHILQIQAELEQNNAGLRKLPGTALKDGAGDTVYTRPQIPDTIETIHAIRVALQEAKHSIRTQYKFYSQDLINNLFTHPYTRIEFIERDLKVWRLTATKYLDALTEGGFLHKQKQGRSNYYINLALSGILTRDSMKKGSQ